MRTPNAASWTSWPSIETATAAAWVPGPIRARRRWSSNAAQPFDQSPSGAPKVGGGGTVVVVVLVVDVVDVVELDVVVDIHVVDDVVVDVEVLVVDGTVRVVVLVADVVVVLDLPGRTSSTSGGAAACVGPHPTARLSAPRSSRGRAPATRGARGARLDTAP
jgi:hypothetical protein